MKKLKHTSESEQEKFDNISVLSKLALENNLNDFIVSGKETYEDYTIEFYEVIGDLLEYIGFEKVSVTRDGDTNNRMDAIIIDKERSIPIEIKSPKEIEYINVKSIRQALENKIVLLSRKFYPTEHEVTSLSIGFEYPNVRSGVFELIEDINKAYGINIGILSFGDILKLFYNKRINSVEICLNSILHISGKVTPPFRFKMTP